MINIKLSTDVVNFIEVAEQKALATYCQGEINVIPVSVVRVVDGNIWLHDFFMNKTAKNVCEEPKGALALWSGLERFQIKGKVSYETKGDSFEEATNWVLENFPDRKLRGLLILTPESVYDISTKVVGAGEQVA